MTTKVSDSVLLQFSEFVASHLGLQFPRDRWLDLQRAAGAAAQECGFRKHDFGCYIEGLLSPAFTPKHLEVLASHLTVGETYFFREKRSLEILEKRVMPDLIRARAGLGTPIRIWSAGCATGEEPYSIAIVLSRSMAGLTNWNVEILATDLNAKSLQKAAVGAYGEWSFRGTPAWVRRTYCEAIGKDRWAVTRAIRKMVDFAPLNLMDDDYPPLSHRTNGFDVIFCRNVLMYFSPDGMRKVIRQLHRSLATDGWLIVSATETSQDLFSKFATVSFGDATFYRKSATHPPIKLAFPVPGFGENRFGENRSVVPLPEWAMPALEPTQISGDEIRRVAPGSEAGSESTAPPAASYRQAVALYEQGRYEEMEQMIATLPSDDGDYARVMLLLARAYANQGKLAEAIDWSDKAIAADKLAAPAHYLRATILQEQGCLPEALLALRQAVYVEPQFVVGHLTLGNLALKQGRTRESKKHFENALLLLAQCKPEDIVPESEGLSVGRLREMIGVRSASGQRSRNERTVGLWT
jgi:chemotaxis protein methyltransferase CheR